MQWREAMQVEIRRFLAVFSFFAKKILSLGKVVLKQMLTKFVNQQPPHLPAATALTDGRPIR